MSPSAPLVVKLGGNAIAGEGLSAVAADLAWLQQQGQRLIVVHGGGPQTSALQKQLGQQPIRIGGRRVTDEATLDAIKMMVGGKLNVEVCSALLAAGAKPVGLHGASSMAIEAIRRPPRVISGGGAEPVDMGLVGDVLGVNRGLLDLLLEAGHMPVLACIGAAVDGSVFNINGDVVANRVAAELKATALVQVSDIVGVLRDKDDPSTRIGQLTEKQARDAIATGVVTEGMIPKLEESFVTIAAGVQRVHIVGKLEPAQLRAELDQPGSVGTALLP